MSFITRDSATMHKDERNKVTLNKDLFAFASEFSDIYFANDLNWSKLGIHYKHSTSNQRKILVLREESNTGWFKASEMARTGIWEIEQIQVYDKDGDMKPILRAGMPSPSTFDIETIRKISPSEEILSTFPETNKVVLGVGKGINYEVAFKVKLWNETDLVFVSPTIYTITSIVGDDVILDQTFTVPAGKTLRLKFPNFVDASPRQKGIYQFIGSTF